MVPKDFIESLGVRVQEPEVGARSVALLFGDQKRYSEVIYSWDGKFLEVNKADGGLLQGADKILVNAANEDRVMVKRREAAALGLIKI